MNSKFILLVITCLWSGILNAQTNEQIVKAFTHAEAQTNLMLKEIKNAQKPNFPTFITPRSVLPTGALKLVPTKDWTSGFFAGNLWFLYEFTQDPKWLSAARLYTAKVEQEKFDSSTHDVGFKIYSSFGAGYRLTQDTTYKKVIIQAAQTLITRFNPKIGCIRSWSFSPNKWTYPVIIDNMLNLELLFAATRLTGDSTYYNVAVSHANKTMINHFRKDFSSWHVVDYSPITGKTTKKTTHQGSNDSSAWARGQAWGLYGFTMCYRETKDLKYLKYAENIAKFIFSHPNMPKDLVPYWDFNAPLLPLEPRDASAAAAMASALYELSKYSTNGSYYRSTANTIINSLTNKYKSAPGANLGFILEHSTGHKPALIEIDVPLIYADYYYLEALIRKNQNNLAPKLTPIDKKFVKAGTTLSFTVIATDANQNQKLTYTLINAPEGATLNSKSGQFTWKPKAAGTYSFHIGVADNGSPILSRITPVVIKVNPLPTFTLTVNITGKGSVSKSPESSKYDLGTTVTLTAIPTIGYRFTGWTGDLDGTQLSMPLLINANKLVTANFVPLPTPKILNFSLINTDNNQPLAVLQEGSTLNLATLGTKNVNIKANMAPGTVSSVLFTLSGPVKRSHLESAGPYYLFDDAKGLPLPWIPVEGSYSLQAIPYSGVQGEGIAGEILKLNFKVINNLTLTSERIGTVNSESATNNSNITVYPNPTADGRISVVLPKAIIGDVTYNLFSVIGTKLSSGKNNLLEPTTTLSFDFSSQMATTGMYYLRLEHTNSKTLIKIVRQ